MIARGPIFCRLLLLAFLVPSGFAAAYGGGAEDFFFEPRVSTGTDIQVGLRAGIGGVSVPKGDLAVFLDAAVRPFPRAVRVRESETFSNQYREVRFGFGPGVAWIVPLEGDWSGMIGAGAAYSDGHYRGTNRDPASGWFGWAESGVRYSTDGSYYWGAAFQYHPLPGISAGRVLLQMGWRFR